MSTSDDGEIVPASDDETGTERGIDRTGDEPVEEIQDPLWYEVPTGKGLAIVFILLTLAAVVASVDGILWEPGKPIPFEVYLYGFLGAMARSLLIFVTEVNPQRDTGPSLDQSWAVMVRWGLRLFGALCLSAGLYLVIEGSADLILFGSTPRDMVHAGVAFVAGFYVERVYITLGRVADRLLSFAETEDTTSDDSHTSEGPRSFTSVFSSNPQQEQDLPQWYAGWRGRLLLAIGLGLSVFAMILTVFSWSIPGFPELSRPMPAEIYVYSFLGAAGYVFTSMFVEFNKGVQSLLRKGIRIPAALLLAAGFYTFTYLFVPNPSDSPGILAAIAFLVGLYVNVALVSLDEIASRVFSRFTKTESSR